LSWLFIVGTKAIALAVHYRYQGSALAVVKAAAIFLGLLQLITMFRACIEAQNCLGKKEFFFRFLI
jgi:hypothetical protein